MSALAMNNYSYLNIKFSSEFSKELLFQAGFPRSILLGWSVSPLKPATTAMHGPHRFSILVTVQLYTMMPEVCRWLTNEKQRKTDIHSINQ